jgi:hypothetical protein
MLLILMVLLLLREASWMILVWPPQWLKVVPFGQLCIACGFQCLVVLFASVASFVLVASVASVVLVASVASVVLVASVASFLSAVMAVVVLRSLRWLMEILFR